MLTKTRHYRNYKKTIFLAKDGKRYVRECTCSSRSTCNLCEDSEDCSLKPEGAGPVVALVMMLTLLFILIMHLAS